MRLAASVATNQAPFKLVFKTKSKSSSVCSSRGLVTDTPALCNRAHRVETLVFYDIKTRLDTGIIGDINFYRNCLATLRFEWIELILGCGQDALHLKRPWHPLEKALAQNAVLVH
jgi:hypothetical protein